MRKFFLLMLALPLVGCSHSEPCCDAITGSDGAFDGSETPIRLTYSGGSDDWPAVSWDGSLISYRYDAGTDDSDHCAATIPILGGPRTINVCATERGQETSTDWFSSLTVMDQGTVAFTHHSGTLFSQAPSEAGLYLASTDDLRGAERVLGLIQEPSGASARYDALLRPVRTGPREIVALAAQYQISAIVEQGPIDTLYMGVELVRINLDTKPAKVTVIASATGANDWDLDATTGTVYLNFPTYLPEAARSKSQIVADTIFTVPLSGGPQVAFWGKANPPTITGLQTGQLTGLAVGGGRVFVSFYQSNGGGRLSQLSEILTEGQERVIAVAGSDSEWGRLAATPDGAQLVAERATFGQSDLYLFDNP